MVVNNTIHGIINNFLCKGILKMNKNLKIAKQLLKLANNLISDENSMDWFKNDYKKIKSNFETWAKHYGFDIKYDSYPDFDIKRSYYDDEPTLSDNEWNLFSAESKPVDLYQKTNGRKVQQTIGVSLMLKVIDKNEKKYELIPQAWRTLNIGGGFKESKSNLYFKGIPSVNDYTIVFSNMIAEIS